MSVRRLPVRPDPEQLHRQAKEFLRGIHSGDANAIAELRKHHFESIDAERCRMHRAACRCDVRDAMCARMK